MYVKLEKKNYKQYERLVLSCICIPYIDERLRAYHLWAYLVQVRHSNHINLLYNSVNSHNAHEYEWKTNFDIHFNYYGEPLYVYDILKN